MHRRAVFPGTDASGWKSSAELYRFLTLLKTNGRRNHLPSMSRRLERIQHLLDWLGKEYANPDLGLAQMSEQLNIGSRQLNERFRELFGQTAYAYLIQLRFIATFRQKEGLTPEKYRRLHGSSSTI